MKTFRLTPMQETMLYEAAADPSRYLTVLRYTLEKSMDTQSFSSRLELLVSRHEALRTTFVRDASGVFRGVVADRVDDRLFKADLQGNELTIQFHHALLDGWSIGVLMGELMSEDEPTGKPSPFRYYIKWLQGRNHADDLDWWRKYLGDERGCSQLPNFCKPDGYERRELRFTLENTELVKKVAQNLRITAGKLLEAVWCMLIARYNGGKSLVCTVKAGRSAPVPGITGMVGMCVNTLPILTTLPEPPESVTFSDWIREWSRSSSEAEKHGFCGLGDLLLGPATHILSIDPPFDGDGYKLELSNARLVTDFDAVFTLGDQIKAEFDYNSRAYSDAAANAVRGHFLTALSAVLENPSIAVEQIPILTGDEISRLTAPNERQDILGIIERQTVADFWRESAETHKEREALVCGKVRLTYAQVSETADRLACALKGRGLSAQDPVAILLPPSEQYVVAELAVMLAGGLFIPLDTRWPEERVKSILAQTNPFMVIDQDAYAELLSDKVTPCPVLGPGPRDAAYMIMTSGTTGVPKGVVVEHRSLANFCLWAKERYGWQAGDSCALELGFSFDGSMWSIWPALISGGTLHILPECIRFDLAALGDYCRTERITHIDLPVTMANAFREIYSEENPLPDLRVMVTGGEEVRAVAAAPYPLSNEYGPTECTVCCSAGWISDGDSPITAGSPVPNMNAYILDGWNRLCPDGVTGEACFSGVQVVRGYHNASDLNAERFAVNPFAGGNPRFGVIYRTGDRMKWHCSGERRELVFVGREDGQVKINGFRIELGEIESVLRQQVAEFAVTVNHRESGEKQLCAYVAQKPGLDLSRLDELLMSRLPAFMRPAVIPVEKIPLTSGGKVDFGKLPLFSAEKTDAVTAPATENEKLLLSAVRRVLGVEDIGTNHNYHELGGNSINAMRIVFALEQDGFSLPVKELITSPSLAASASKMLPVRAENTLPAPVRGPQRTFPPLPAQQAFIFLTETENPEMYCVTLTLDAKGLDAKTLKKRLDKAAGLHDILRAEFEYGKDGRIVGRIGDSHRIRISGGEPCEAVSLNPLLGPLLDLSLHEDKLTLRYHHIALDGWSVNLLIDELLHGKFPETAPSFADFANRLAAEDGRRAADEAWWRENFKNAETVSLLPPKTCERPRYSRIKVCTPELMADCANAARKARVTPASFALAAWGVVLNALGAEDGDILIAFVASCRDDDNLMGMCAEARPLVFGGPGADFGELARRTQEAMLAGVSHWFTPQEVVGKLPGYLFVYEDASGGYIAEGDQNYDLIVKFSGGGSPELIYNDARLPEADAQDLASRLNGALASAVLNRVSALRNGEYELVAGTFARGRRLESARQGLPEAFIAAAKSHAGQTALETATESLSYCELYDRAKGLSKDLAARGIGKGDIVAFCLPRNAEGIVAQIGIALSGAAFLPLDPAWPDGRVDEILRDSRAAAVIRNGLAIEPTGEKGGVPADSAYVIYTSGTTGKPKGVILPQAALANQIAWAIDEFGFGAGDRVLHYIAFTFDPSVWVIFTALCAGATLSLMPEPVRLDPDGAARYIEEQRITRCTFPSAVASDILRRVKKSCLKTVFLGGEAIKNLPPGRRGYETVNCYGPTEACINAAFYRLQPGETETCRIGKPVANTLLLVLDSRAAPCPVGVQGDLYIGGVQLAHGYLNRPLENQAAFTLHPVFGRLYKTGDRAVWNKDGTLSFSGRRDRQVKIRGYRVELSEIEHAICETSGASDARVRLTEGAIDAYLIPRGNTPLPEDSLMRQRLSEKLPSYMIPRSFTVMESFPLNQNGKIDFNALPTVCAPARDQNAAPLSGTEEAIAAAWKTALGLSPDFMVAREDSFYDLGGHSLLLFHVVGMLSASGIRADIKTLIEHPVLADLSAAINNQKQGRTPARQSAGPEANADAYALHLRNMGDVDLSEKRVFRNVLITGGTGFLGSHLVREFYMSTDAMLHLPVRGKVEKLWDALHYYFGKLAEEMSASGRIRPCLSDISEGSPDLDVPLDAIFHAAADIRHYAPEPEMYRANVTATENMLALAKGNPDVLFAHISTTSAVNAPVIYETDTDLGPVFDNIYQRTKQLAEQKVLEAGERGQKYLVFRVGHVSPGFEDGSVARNWEINAMLRLINSMLLTGLLPEQDYKIGYGYADESARAIRLLSAPLRLENMVFHIDNPNSLRLSELFKLAGLRGQVLPRHRLVSRLEELSETGDKAVRQAAAEYLGRLAQGGMEKESTDVVQGKLFMDATLLLLKRMGFEWPQVTADYMRRVIRSLIEGGMA